MNYPIGGIDNPVIQYREEEKEKLRTFLNCEILVLELLGYGNLIKKARETGDIDWIKKIEETKKGKIYLGIASQVCEGKITIQQLKMLLEKEKISIEKERFIKIIEGGKVRKKRIKVEEEITKKAEFLEKYPERYSIRVFKDVIDEIERTPYMKTANIILDKLICDKEQKNLISRIFFLRFKELLPLPEEGDDIKFMVEVLNDICELSEKQQKVFPFRIPKENKEAMYLAYKMGFTVEELGALAKRPLKEKPSQLKHWMIKPFEVW